MSFINNNKSIKEKRVQYFINKLYYAMTKLLVLDNRAYILINEDSESNYIANLSTNDGDSYPLLPLGTEEVLTWNSLNFNMISNSKFDKKEFNVSTQLYDRIRYNVLEADYAENGESLPSDVTALDNGLKIKDGLIILKNLEQYDYDYKSYEILHEIYKALEIFLNSVESFFSNFYIQPLSDYITDNPNDDSASSDSILVYDTTSIDEELEYEIFPIADNILNETNRTLVKSKYNELRDTIKFFCMDTVALEIENYIDMLLLCINGSKKYSVRKNVEMRVLEITVDENGYERRLHKEEEVFYPFHNKFVLEEFMQGLSFIF